MTGIPGQFDSPANEWYVWKPDPRVNKNVRILATLDPSDYPIGFKDILTSGDLPVVWTNTKYRMLYMNMGHADKIFTSPIQNRLIDNAVTWLGTGATPETPEGEGSGIRISAHGIVVDSQTGKFYAVNTSKDTVTVLDRNGHFDSRIPVGKEPVSLASNPDTNRIYVANSGSGNVSVIDGHTDKVIATVPVGESPYVMAVNRPANKVYVSRTFSDVTVIIDGKTDTPITIKAGVGDAVAAESLDNGTYMASFESLRVTVFDGKNDLTSKIETPNHMWAIAGSPARNKIYAVSVGNSNVTIIDGTTHATKTASTGEIPCAVAVDDSSGKAFVANFASNDVTVLDGASDTVVGTINVGPKPQAIAVDSNNHKVYVVSTHERTVTVLDGTNNSVLGTVRTEKWPFAIAVNSQTHVVALLSLDGDLTLIDGTTMATSSPSVAKDQR